MTEAKLLTTVSADRVVQRAAIALQHWIQDSPGVTDLDMSSLIIVSLGCNTRLESDASLIIYRCSVRFCFLRSRL